MGKVRLTRKYIECCICGKIIKKSMGSHQNPKNYKWACDSCNRDDPYWWREKTQGKCSK